MLQAKNFNIGETRHSTINDSNFRLLPYSEIKIWMYV